MTNVNTSILKVKLSESSGGSRIFPRGVRQLPKVLLFFNFVPENCMKMKEFGPRGASLVPPLKSANGEECGDGLLNGGWGQPEKERTINCMTMKKNGSGGRPNFYANSPSRAVGSPTE